MLNYDYAIIMNCYGIHGNLLVAVAAVAVAG